MGGVKGPHHRGSYHRRSRIITAAANAFPDTRCWRCSLTLTEIKAQYPDREVKWTAGHVNDGEIEGELAPECSPCNYGAGARLVNRRRKGGGPSREW